MKKSAEEGSVMIVAMVALVALLGLGGLTVLSVRGGSAATGHERFSDIARYAAESGGAAGMEFLRENFAPGANWTAFVNPNNENVVPNPDVLGSTDLPGLGDNPFSPQLGAWYEVRILNNETDPEFATGGDSDGRVLLHVTGHGPNGTVSVVELEVQPPPGVGGGGVPCPSYAQKNISELGTGNNPCLGTVDSTNSATFKPGE